MITRKQLLSYWPDVLGIGALALPFSSGVSPLEALLIFGFSAVWQIWLLAAALLLVIPIAAWQVLRVLYRKLTRTEQALAYALSTGAMLPPVVLIILWVGKLLLGDEPWKDNFPLEVLMAVSLWALIAVNALLLRHNLRAAAPAELSAGVYLLGGYLPSATFLLVMFSIPGSGWDIGAYVVLAACIGYVLRIISLMRHGTKGYRAEENPALAD